MAKILGDRLIVNLARKPGEEQWLNLMDFFNLRPNRTIAVAATVGLDGAPNTAPLSLIYAQDEKTLLVATLRHSTTTANLRRDGRVSLEIFGEQDLALGLQGTMVLVKEPLDASDAMVCWEMQVERVKLDTSPAQRLFQAPAATPRSDKGREFEAAVWAEVSALGR